MTFMGIVPNGQRKVVREPAGFVDRVITIRERLAM
jgi:hypothetical protein